MKMKNILKLTLITLLLISCKESPESKSLEGIANEIAGKNTDINDKYDLLLKQLGTKTPLTNDQLIAAFPNKFGKLNLDASRNNNSNPRIMGSQVVTGSFADSAVRMEILDAAGEKATEAVLPLKMLHLNKITSENNNTIRYSKQERDGILTFGTDHDQDTKADYQSELRFLYDNRFYVTLQAKGMDTKELWKTIKIDDLRRFKEFNKQ